MTQFRLIPSIDALLERPAFAALAERHGREPAIAAARRAADAARAEIAARRDGWPASADDAAAWIERRAAGDLAAALAPPAFVTVTSTLGLDAPSLMVRPNWSPRGMSPTADAV